MPPTTLSAASTDLTPARGWRRLFVALALSGATGWLLGQGWRERMASIVMRAVAVGLIATLVFSVLEHWPGRLPRLSER
jgi:hypothetical protein